MQQADTAETHTTRDIFMDNLKGLLIVSVVFVHMYDMTCAKNSWTHLMRLAILTVQMPLFMFISGYFGKNTKKRQKEAVESYLIPFFVFNTLYFFVRHWQGEDFTYGILRPFNMYWYLLTLILYRLLMDNLRHVRGLFPLSIALALLAGLDEHMGRTLSLSRAVCFFPFYLMGFYCTKKWVDRAKRIPRTTAALLIVLCTLLAEALGLVLDPSSAASHPYQLVNSYEVQELTWQSGMLMRASIYILAPVMGAAVMALCAKKRCILTAIGSHSLEVYLLHAFPMLLVLQLLEHRLPATGATLVCLAVYALAVSRLLSCEAVSRVYHGIFDRIKAIMFPEEEQPFFPFPLFGRLRHVFGSLVHKRNRQTP